MFPTFCAGDIDTQARLLKPLFDNYLEQLVDKEAQIQSLTAQLQQSNAQGELLQQEKLELLGLVQDLQIQVGNLRKSDDARYQASEQNQGRPLDSNQQVAEIYNVDKVDGINPTEILEKETIRWPSYQQPVLEKDGLEYTEAENSKRGLVRQRNDKEGYLDVEEPPVKKQFLENPDNYQLSHPIIILQGVITTIDGDSEYVSERLLQFLEERLLQFFNFNLGIPPECFFEKPSFQYDEKINYCAETSAMVLEGVTYRLATAWTVLTNDQKARNAVLEMKCDMEIRKRAKPDWEQFCIDWNLMCCGEKNKQLPKQQDALYAFEATPSDVLKFLPEFCKEYLIEKQISDEGDIRSRQQQEDDEYLNMLEDQQLDVEQQQQASGIQQEHGEHLLKDRYGVENSGQGIYSEVGLKNSFPEVCEEIEPLITIVDCTREELLRFAKEKSEHIRRLEEKNNCMEQQFFGVFQQLCSCIRDQLGEQVIEGNIVLDTLDGLMKQLKNSSTTQSNQI